jgi:hypothetical protein
VVQPATSYPHEEWGERGCGRRALFASYLTHVSLRGLIKGSTKI